MARRDTGEGLGHKGKESETSTARTSQKKRRSIDGIPHHGHQTGETPGRSKQAAARCASASSVKVRGGWVGGGEGGGFGLVWFGSDGRGLVDLVSVWWFGWDGSDGVFGSW